jgi:glycosyltransferase involved in cell wall biosynthesis
MKVLFISDAKSIHTVRWVNALAGRGHEVHLVSCCNHAPSETATIVKDVSIHLLRFPSPYGYFLNEYALRKLYKVIKPDIVNVHYASGYGTLARNAKIAPYILSVWGSDVYDFPYESRFKMFTIKKNLCAAQVLASTSHVMAEQTRRLLGNSDIEIAVTPFGVDTELFAPKIEEESNAEIKQNKRIKVGTVKTLEPKYGIDDSLRAFKRALDEWRRTGKGDFADRLHYEIYGTGSQKNHLMQLTKELDIDDKVYFGGYIQNTKLPDIIRTFDFFICTSNSDSESFGVAAVEAMSCGIPCITSDADGFREVMKNNKTGYVVERGNIEAISQAILTLVCEDETRKSFGKNARLHVLENYDWNASVKIMESLYERSII